MPSCAGPFVRSRFFIFMGLSLSSAAFAASTTSIMQTAPVKGVGEFEARLQGDIIFNHGGGVNLSPHLETGIVDHLIDMDAFFGVGKTDFMAGASAKFNLLPDVPDQVGLSFLGGFTFVRDEQNNFGVWNLGALVSKRLTSSFGHIVPYGAFQFETIFDEGNSTVPLSIALGAKWEPTDAANRSFFTEAGISLRKSNYYLGLGAGYPF